jgi:CPA1 family monovalent cation:H+ antiporter
MRLGSTQGHLADSSSFREVHAAAYAQALLAARRTLLELRSSGVIGDDAFHSLEDEIDWMELAGPTSRVNGRR